MAKAYSMSTKILLRNIGWIALLAVWSFWAGGYFNLGWHRDYSMGYTESLIMGGVALISVLLAIGLIVRKVAKKNGSTDSSKIALFVVSLLTAFFMLLAWIKYDDVQKDKFMKELEPQFISFYLEKAEHKNIEIENLRKELSLMCSYISFELKSHPDLYTLMELKTKEALFEKNEIIPSLSLKYLEMQDKLDNEKVQDLRSLFTVD